MSRAGRGGLLPQTDRGRLLARVAPLPRTGCERGSVTAEFAAAAPAVVILLALCLAALQLGSLQVRVQDAAAVAARIVARGEQGSAGAAIDRLAPGASAATTTIGDLVCVTVRAGPGGGPFAAVRLAGSSCAPLSRP